MAHSDDELIAAYYKYQQTNADEDFWVWEEVDSRCHNLESGLQITTKLIELAPSHRSLSQIAAAHLEDLVFRFGAPAVNAIAEVASLSSAMRKAICVVNVDEESEANAPWEALLAKHHESDPAL